MRVVRLLSLAALLLLAGAALAAPAALAQDGGESFRGRVFQGAGANQVRIEGVTITVTDADGEEVGSGVTDADGEAVIELPGPGEYTATLDTSTLPEGLAPSGDVTERTARIQPGRTGNALFQVLGEGGTAVGGGRDFGDKLGRVPQLALDGAAVRRRTPHLRHLIAGPAR